MKPENTAILRLDLWDLYNMGIRIHEAYDEIHTDKCIKRKWLPMTVFESVWVMFEFKTKKEKDEYLENLPEKYKTLEGFIKENPGKDFIERWVIPV